MEAQKRFIANYEVIKDIASGSYGKVCLVQHRFLRSRYAAMKLLLSTRLRSRHERKRFIQEAQILEMLKHRFILPIDDVGIYEGIPYMVVKYASRGSLRARLEQNAHQPLPLAEATTIITQIAQALYFAHLKGILHHDVKPDNILFNDRGEAVLADFGIATMLHSVVNRQATAAIGTPMYMAPEQFLGKISRRSDQYSLACVAYELVTGRPPFYGDNAIVLGHKHNQEKPLPLSQFNPDVPPYMEQAILKALEKQRGNRFEDVLHFMEAVQGISRELPQPSVSAQSRPLVLALNPKTKEQWLRDGNSMHNLQQYEEALVAEEQAILLDPSYADAYNCKGVTLYALARYEEALAAFEQALHSAGEQQHLHYNRFLALQRLGRLEEAQAAYKQAMPSSGSHLDWK